jgi:hypothetical protein
MMVASFAWSYVMTAVGKAIGATVLLIDLAAMYIGALGCAGINIGALTPGGAMALLAISSVLMLIISGALLNGSKAQPYDNSKAVYCWIFAVQPAILLTLGILGLTKTTSLGAAMASGWAITFTVLGCAVLVCTIFHIVKAIRSSSQEVNYDFKYRVPDCREHIANIEYSDADYYRDTIANIGHSIPRYRHILGDLGDGVGRDGADRPYAHPGIDFDALISAPRTQMNRSFSSEAGVPGVALDG